MSVTDGKQDIGEVDWRDATRGLAHAVSYILFQLAIINMDEDGHSPLISGLLLSIDKQACDVIPDDGKKYVMGLCASIEHSLRELAEREKNQRGGQ